MNDEQLNKLFAAARPASPAVDRVALAFETRLLARLRAERQRATPWFAWTWRLAPIFAAVVIALGAWNYFAPATTAEATEETIVVALLAGEE